MENEKAAAVMTPVFDGTRYLHHVCSECKGTLKFKQSCYGGVSFYAINGVKCEEMKFCPLCGGEIVRFSDKAIYETPIDLSPLDAFAKLREEYVRKARWLYWCYINDAHREEVDKIFALAKSYPISEYYSKALGTVLEGRYSFGASPQALRKLREEFGTDTER